MILHGWGLNGGVYQKLKTLLEKDGFSVFAPDLPGFGMEPQVNKSMKLDDYANFVRNFIQKKGIKKVIFIGHSFGGRVAIKYAWQYPQEVSKLILTGVPVIRHNSFKKKIAFIIAVIGGKILKISPQQLKKSFRKLLYFAIGEWDYYRAGPLRQVFKNIIGEDLVQYIAAIKIPVLLIWGEKDKVVPFSDGQRIHRMIADSTLVVVKEIGHKAPYESAEKFSKAVLEFLHNDQ